jgi:flagellar basal body-associated protein FliL
LNFEVFDLQLHLEITYILNSFLSPEKLDIKKVFFENTN